MNPDLQEPADQDWCGVVVECLEALDNGQPLDRQAYLARHPQFADQLHAFFAQHDCLDQLAAPLRATAEAARTVAQCGEVTPLVAGGVTPGPAALDLPAVDGYEILEKIAEGGMGLIYKARQKEPLRLVALKMIQPGQALSEAELQRFRSEMELASSLEHPHIVPVYDVGRHGSRLYFTMRLMEGGNLAHWAATLGLQVPDFQKWAARLVAQVARAVHYAHQHGILHRDLKPSNILLDAEGQPHVADFGLAKRLAPRAALDGAADLTRSGAILGTPGYVAPELTYGKRDATSTAADIYGLGGILYFLLAGKPPFADPNPVETLRQVRELEAAPPHTSNTAVNRDLETICLKCLQKAPALRYTSAAALAEDLDRWLGGLPIQARRQGRWARGRLWVRRNPGLATTTAIAAVLALALIAGSLVVAWRDAEAANRRAVAAETEARRLRLDRYLNDIHQAFTAWTIGDSPQ
jgi:serine/threonine-protein kinase